MRSTYTGRTAGVKRSLDDLGVQNLIYSVVNQAVLDYKSSLYYLYRNRNWRTERAKLALQTIHEIREFFMGEWYSMMYEVSGEEMIKRLEKGYSVTFLQLL